MKVLVTDHHLPGDELPDALAIVNPNQPGCEFPSKNLAGVGVIFYLMLALRAELRQRGVYEANAGPRLNELADLVALGTVADVVSLDANNRLIVTQGLERMRKGQMQAGLRALFQVAGRDPRQASAFDLGFALGPRINAAGRLADMALGIRCLITDDEDEAANLARELEDMNQDRRSIEQSMREEALRAAELAEPDTSATVCVFHPEWHQGIVGLVASRLKEKYWRPTLAFAQGDEGEIKGSGRSIPDVHLRDALDLVSKRYPGLILKFGGHAMAAGLTIEEDNYDNKHLKLSLERNGEYFDAIWFNRDTLLPENIEAAYRLDQNEWNGNVSVQFIIEYAQGLRPGRQGRQHQPRQSQDEGVNMHSGKTLAQHQHTHGRRAQRHQDHKDGCLRSGRNQGQATQIDNRTDALGTKHSGQALANNGIGRLAQDGTKDQRIAQPHSPRVQLIHPVIIGLHQGQQGNAAHAQGQRRPCAWAYAFFQEVPAEQGHHTGNGGQNNARRDRAGHADACHHAKREQEITQKGLQENQATGTQVQSGFGRRLAQPAQHGNSANAKAQPGQQEYRQRRDQGPRQGDITAHQRHGQGQTGVCRQT
uniref:Single-stranded-DNA-specific exonuclease RecJ n=1 Tax=Steinernema glaseri TaxID=37863 RepID=A0A1I8AN45_9BILA